MSSTAFPSSWKILRISAHFCLLVVVTWFFAGASVHAQSSARAGDRARVTVQSVPDLLGGAPLKVLRTDTNTPLRAGGPWLFKETAANAATNAPAKDPAFYRTMRDAGLNAVRLIQFEVWFQSDDPTKTTRYTDFDNATERNALLANLETAVNLASDAGLYVIINPHTKLNSYQDDYTRTFWTHVAPYFANRTHVLYELTNEPLGDLDTYIGNDTFLDQQQSLYALIKSLAPATHQQLLSPNGIWNSSGGTTVLKTLTDQLEARKPGAIDWTNASVAYHLYYNGHTSERMRELHKAYPGFPSENNFAYDGVTPFGVNADDEARSESMDVPLSDRTRFANQACEQLGVGWAHWHLESYSKFENNWPLIRADAESKKYFWAADSSSTAN